MIGMTTTGMQTQAENGTPAWLVALRDSLLVFALVTVPAVMLTKPESWSDFWQFEHVGVPILSGIEMFIVSLAVRYGVTIPKKEVPP